MRKHARNWLMKILLGIVIVVFIFYFGSMRGSDKADAIATINGKAISRLDFQKEYQFLVDFYRQRYGGALTDKMIKELNLKQQAYDNLIHQAIILKKATDLNLAATDEDVRTAILSNPVFHRDGVFDEQMYQQALRYNRMTPADFESAQKREMTIAKMRDLLRDGIKVSDREVYDLYRLQNEKLNLQALFLSAKDFKKNIKVDRGALEEYLKEHGNEFLVPEKFQIKYLSFAGQDHTASVKVSDAEVRDYYERHKDKFAKTGGKLTPLAEAKPGIIDDLKQVQGMYIAADEAKKARDTIYQKENFDEYALQNGLKVAVTDFFSASSPPQEFKKMRDFPQTVRELDVNEISAVLSDNQRYYLVKLTAKRPPHVPPLQEIEGEITQRYLEGESRRLCKKDADAVLERLKKGESWQKVSAEKDLKIAETGFFMPGADVPKIGSSEELLKTVMTLSERNPYPDSPLFINGNYVIVKFKERGKLDTRNFEAQKGPLKNLLLNMKRNEYLRSWLEYQKTSMMKEKTLSLLKDVKDL